MDRFRSLQYFVAAAQARSLSGAARALGVSSQAATKGVAALEAELGVALFERAPQGLTLTAAGTAYLESSQAVLDQMASADEHARAGKGTPEGHVVLGLQSTFARHLLAPALPRFVERFPRIVLELRDYDRGTPDQLEGVDLFAMVGWNPHPDLIARQIGANRFWIVATPEYWARHGVPTHPSDLAGYPCLRARGRSGMLMDRWDYRRGDETGAVTVEGWLMTSNAHIGALAAALLGGLGASRLLDLGTRALVQSGRLVRVLADWEFPPDIPTTLMIKPGARRIARVRAVADFITEIAAAAYGPGPMPDLPPQTVDWPLGALGRASDLAARRARQR